MTHKQMIVLLFVSEYPGKFIPSDIENSVHTELEENGWLDCFARGGGKPLYALTEKAKKLFNIGNDDKHKAYVEEKFQEYKKNGTKEDNNYIYNQTKE